MTLWFYAGANTHGPDQAAAFEDEDAEWHEALNEVRVAGDKAGKVASPAVCGAEFVPGATTKFQGPENLIAVHALILDVDDWSSRPPFTEEEIRDILQGYRFIAWTTWSSTPDLVKWRVVVPLLTPMPPVKFQALWRKLNEVLENTMVEQSVADPGRLGFFGTVQSETAKDYYHYFIAPGERLDWTLFDLEDSDVGLTRSLEPADLTRSPDWSNDDEALRSAKRYFGKVGADVEVGGRHETLLRIGCRLWWDFAAKDGQWVYDVLALVNSNFPEPKADEDVWAEVEASRDRTLGENRVDQPTMYGYEREPIARATLTGIQEHAKALKRQGREDSRAKGRALDSMAKGHAFAEPVEARALAYAAATELATIYGREQPDRLLDLMRPSLQAQRSKSSVHPVPSDVELLTKIRWKQAEIRRRQDDREKDRQDGQRRSVSEAFDGQRDAPYTAKEYKEFEAQGHGDNRWILQKDREFYFFVGGSYRGPYGEKVSGNYAHVMLAPASDRVSTTYVNEKGKVCHRGIDELAREYGTFVNKVEHCLYASGSSFEESERKLVLAELKQRNLEPTFVPEVDTWLRLFAGARYDDLQLWLSACGSFDRELSALMLVTEPNQGKKLLLDGLCRIWQTAGPKTLEKALPTDIAKCPVLLCDERLPFYWRQDVASRIREMLSESNRALRPGGPDLRGFVRLVLMGNSAAMLWRNVEELTPTERAATKQRLLTIDTRGNTDAEEYLEKLGSMHRQFVTQDLIAKHVLWLQETVALPADRFVINDVLSSAPVPALAADHLSNPLVDEIGMWFYRVFSDSRIPNNALMAYEDDLLVHIPELLKVWSQHSTDQKNMDKKKLGLFMAAFCSSKTERYITMAKGKQQRVRLRQFKLDAYEQWLIEQGLDVDDVVPGIQEVALRRRVKSKG